MKELFSKYQQPLLTLANNKWGRKFLGIDKECKDKIIGLTDNAYFIQVGRRKYQATFRCYPVFAKRLHYALTSIDIAQDWLTRNKAIYQPLPQYAGLLNYAGLTKDGRFPNIMLTSPETYYSGAGDGVVWTIDKANWAAARDATSGNDADYLSSTIASPGRIVAEPSLHYYVYRGFFPIDTSGLPDTATISDATFTITADDTATGGSYNLNLVQTSQASASELVVDDFNNLTFTSGADTIARPSGAGATAQFTLDGTGKEWINKTGITYLGSIHNNDLTNTDPGTGYGNIYFPSRFSEYTGTTSDPKLVVTYTVAVADDDGMGGFNFV